MRRDMHRPIDLRSIALRAAFCGLRAADVDDRLNAFSDLRRQAPGADRLLALHEPAPADLLYLLGDLRQAKLIGSRSRYRLIFEGADPVELGLVEPVEKEGEILFGLAGEADDESRAYRHFRAERAPRPDPLKRLFLVAGAAHRLEHTRGGVLKGRVHIGEHRALRHQADDFVNVRIGIDILQPDPGAQRAEFASKIEEFGPDLARPVGASPGARAIAKIDAVCAGVLRDDDQLLDARFHESLRFPQHVACRARDQIASQLRDDAERAAVIATL